MFQVNIVREGEDMRGRRIWRDHKTKNVAALAIAPGDVGTFF